MKSDKKEEDPKGYRLGFVMIVTVSGVEGGVGWTDRLSESGDRFWREGR